MMASRLNDQCKLNPKLNSGHIIILAGPDPQKAIYQYRKYKLYTWCTLVENDLSIFANAKAKFKEHIGEVLILDNIFKVAKREKENIRGIDFDFCTTLKPELVTDIAKAISNLHKPCIWFRVTSCHRRISSKELKIRQKQIISYIKSHSDYCVTDEASINYRDTTPMNTWQIVLRNNQKMEEGTMRTLKEMTQEERDMARALVDRKYNSNESTNYEDKDIARVLKMSPYSVSALKAHVTMRNQGMY